MSERPPANVPPPLTERERRSFARAITGTALLLLVLGCAVVVAPFASALLWAAVLWIAAAPLHQRVLAWVSGRRTVAALAMSLGVTLILLAPLVTVGLSVADSARDLAGATRDWLAGEPSDPPGWVAELPIIGPETAEYWRSFAGDSQRLLTEAQRFIEPATAWLVSGGLALGRGLVELGLSILIAFFFFRDATFLRSRISSAAEQIAGPRGEHLLELALGTVRSVVNGILGTAVVQGTIAGIGFIIAGVPGAILLGLLTAFMSIVPMGPPLVWMPATLWLYQQGYPGWSVFMLIWGIGVSSVDNFVKPWLISQGSTLPFILILFGVIGGAVGFGVIGIFLGPTLLALGYRLLQDWAVVRESTAMRASTSTPAGTPPARDAAPAVAPVPARGRAAFEELD